MKQIWLIILVALVVAVISSIITANITGNIIKVQPTINGTDIYTKSEIDNKLSYIRAHSCDADGLCEVTSTLYSRNNTLTLTSPLSNVFVRGFLTVSSLANSGNLTNQTGNAYICADRNGKLFRTISKC